MRAHTCKCFWNEEEEEKEREREANVSWPQISEAVTNEAKMNLAASSFSSFPLERSHIVPWNPAQMSFLILRVYFSFQQALTSNWNLKQIGRFPLFFPLNCACAQNECFANEVWLIEHVVCL